MKLRLPNKLVAALAALTAAAAYGDVYTIESGTEISLSALPAGTTSVTGSGTLNLGTGKSLGTITLDAGWEGTVKISNTSFNGENLNSLTNSQSVLELSGITGGHLQQWNTGDSAPTTANIRLAKTVNAQGAEVAAFVYSNGAGGSQTWNSFSGTWSGDGMFKKTGGYQESFKWTGDISAWTGSFVTESSKQTGLVILNNAAINASFTNAGSAAMSLTINDSSIAQGRATSVSGNISNTDTGSSTLTASTNTATVTFSGTLSGLSTITLDGRGTSSDNTLDIAKIETATNGTTLATSWYGGTFKLGALSGTGDLTLQMDAAATTQARLYINGAGSKAFTGDIILYKKNSSGDNRSGVVILNHESVAQNSTFITKSENRTATLALGVNVSNAKLAGINDDAQMGPNHLTIYSGAESKDNSITNTLELTGSGTYSTAATLQNVNLKMSGTGTQVFTGDLTGFTGSVAINSGAVSLGNSNASTQLTIAGDVSGNGTLYFHGGSVKYTGTATNKGGVVIQDGATVEISSENFLGAAVTVNSGANLRFQRKNTSNKGSYIENVNADRITLAGGTILGIVNDEGNVTNTIADLNVTAASVIQEEHWASHWNINKLTGEGDLTWRAWSNNTASSVMKISGTGAYSGKLTVDGRSATNGWSGNGYKYFSVLEVASASALQSAVVNLDGKNEKNILSLALNSSTVNLGGLDGTEHSIVYSGAAASSTRDVPAGDGTTRTMVINSAAETQHEFAGVLQSGINITMAGAGTQSFTGDLSAFNGSVEASNGVLKLADSGSSTVSLKALNLSGGNIELAGGSYSIGANDNVHGVFGRDNAAINSSLILNNGASLTLTTPYAWWQFQVNAGTNSGVYVKGKAAGDNGVASTLNATLHDGGVVKIKALDTSSLTGAHITNSGNKAQNFAIDQDYITITDADYSINYGTSDKTVNNKLQGTAVTNEGTGTLTISNAANTLAGLYAKTGNIAISTDQSVSGSAKAEGGKSIIVNSGKTLSLGTGATIAASGTSAATLIGATATVGGISKTAGAATASIDKATVTISGQGYSIDGVTISDSNVTAANGATGTLSNSTITMTHAQGDAPHTNTFDGVTVSENVSAYVAYGNTLQFLNQSTAVNLKDLVIGSGAKVEAYIGTPTQEQINAAQNGTMGIEQNISVSGTLTANTNAKLYADLTLNNGAKLDIADATSGSKNGLTMGSSVTIAQNAEISLSDNIISGLNSLTVGSGLTLFSGVDSFNLGGAAYNEANTYTASDYFNLKGVNIPSDFVIKYGTGIAALSDGTNQAGQSIFIWREMPEPATTTLSLLALAALAARRKRH